MDPLQKLEEIWGKWIGEVSESYGVLIASSSASLPLHGFSLSGELRTYLPKREESPLMAYKGTSGNILEGYCEQVSRRNSGLASHPYLHFASNGIVNTGGARPLNGMFSPRGVQFAAIIKLLSVNSPSPMFVLSLLQWRQVRLSSTWWDPTLSPHFRLFLSHLPLLQYQYPFRCFFNSTYVSTPNLQRFTEH